MHFMAVNNSRKRSGFVIYSYLEDSELVTAVNKRDVNFKTGIRKGYIFVSKMVYKRVRGWTSRRGGTSLYKKVLITPPGVEPMITDNVLIKTPKKNDDLKQS